MKRILLILAVGIMGAGTLSAQSSTVAKSGASTQSQTSAKISKPKAKASVSATPGIPDISTGTKIDATLTHPLDVKNNKPGDRVEAVAAHDVKQNGNVVLKKGTRLIGHVTEVQTRSNGHAQSQLGIVFDHAITINDQNMPFNATVQALAASQASADAQDNSAAHGGGTLVNGIVTTTGRSSDTIVTTSSSASRNANGAATSRSQGAVGGVNSTGRLAPNSKGVFGLQGISINSAASSAAKGSTIVSPTKNVHLDNGTQMLLSVSGHAQQK